MANAQAVSLGPGDSGTVATVQRMRALVRQSFAEPSVRFVAVQIVRGLTETRSQVVALREWLEAHVEFLRDPRGVEYLHAPDWLLRRGFADGVIQGDCDDVAMLAAALGMAVGLRARFVVVGRDQFEHVYTELANPHGGPWWELDTTRPAQGIDPTYFRRCLIAEV